MSTRKFLKIFDTFIYWPICRAYVRCFLGDKPANGFLGLLCKIQFAKINHFWPIFKKPQKFSEKLWARMLYDRDPLLTIISDKLRVRDYVAGKVGTDFLIPLLWNGDNPNEIPYNALPMKFVIKANHGCGYNIIVKNKNELDHLKVKTKLNKWLKTNFCMDTYLGIAWGYKNVKPCLMIEKFIEDNGAPPTDYKFYCFSGRLEILTVHIDRFGVPKILAFDRNFEPHEAGFDKSFKKNDFNQPQSYDKMIQLAESLAKGFEFIRVDLYNIKNTIYFGELTPYPAGVSFLRGFNVSKIDGFLGEKWKKSREI